EGRPIARGQTAADHADAVGAGVQVGERVVAVAGGGGGGDDVAAVVEELDGGAVDAGLTGILDTVAVGVVPDAVADRSRAAVAEVDVGARGAGSEGEAGGVRRGDAVEVER